MTRTAVLDRGRATHPGMLGIIVGALVMVGCAAPATQQGQASSQSAPALPSATAKPAQTDAAATATSSATPSPVATPASSAAEVGDFQYGDILRVDVDRLAVRRAPTLTSPLTQGYRFGAEGAEPTGDVRISTGYFLSVHLGPLRNGDTVWYLVWPAQDARLYYNTGIWWDSNGDAGADGPEPGWVAASAGTDQYLSLYRRPASSEIEQNLPVGLTVAGAGDYESAPQPGHDLFLFNWAAAPASQGSPCPFSVTLIPEQGGDPVVAVEMSSGNVRQGPLTGPNAVLDTSWSPSTDGSWNTFVVSVSSGCSWTLGLHALYHD